MVTLRIFLFGLIAIVTDEESLRRTADQVDRVVTVLVLDARNPPAATDGCPVHPHEPFLLFKGRSCRHPCRRDLLGLCRCPLDGDEIKVTPCVGQGCNDIAYPKCTYGNETTKDYSKNPFSGLECFAQMKALKRHALYNFLDGLLRDGANIHPDCIDADEGCNRIVGRAHRLRTSAITPCVMIGEGEIPFRSLTKTNIIPHKQVLSEVTLLTVPVKPTADGTVEINLRSFRENSSTHAVLQTFPCPDYPYYPSKRCADLLIANTVLHPRDEFGPCGDDRIGRHFELYNDLAREPLSRATRVAPQVEEEVERKSTGCCRSELLDDFEAFRERSSLDRIICPQPEYKKKSTLSFQGKGNK